MARWAIPLDSKDRLCSPVREGIIHGACSVHTTDNDQAPLYFRSRELTVRSRTTPGALAHSPSSWDISQQPGQNHKPKKEQKAEELQAHNIARDRGCRPQASEQPGREGEPGLMLPGQQQGCHGPQASWPGLSRASSDKPSGSSELGFSPTEAVVRLRSPALRLPFSRLPSKGSGGKDF